MAIKEKRFKWHLSIRGAKISRDYYFYEKKELNDFIKKEYKLLKQSYDCKKRQYALPTLEVGDHINVLGDGDEVYTIVAFEGTKVILSSGFAEPLYKCFKAKHPRVMHSCVDDSANFLAEHIISVLGIQCLIDHVNNDKPITDSVVFHAYNVLNRIQEMVDSLEQNCLSKSLDKKEYKKRQKLFKSIREMHRFE